MPKIRRASIEPMKHASLMGDILNQTKNAIKEKMKKQMEKENKKREEKADETVPKPNNGRFTATD